MRALLREYGISARLTFSNSLLQKEHLRDPKCNALCALFEADSGVQNGIIVHSELLLEYLKARYPGFYLSLIHISEPTRRTPISYAVFCLKKKKNRQQRQECALRQGY